MPKEDCNLKSKFQNNKPRILCVQEEKEVPYLMHK